jgi:hypothetical protein
MHIASICAVCSDIAHVASRIHNHQFCLRDFLYKEQFGGAVAPTCSPSKCGEREGRVSGGEEELCVGVAVVVGPGYPEGLEYWYAINEICLVYAMLMSEIYLNFEIVWFYCFITAKEMMKLQL